MAMWIYNHMLNNETDGTFLILQSFCIPCITLQSCNQEYFRPPVVCVDPDRRCAVMLIYGTHIVVLPFRQEGVLDEHEQEGTFTARYDVHKWPDFCNNISKKHYGTYSVDGCIDLPSIIKFGPSQVSDVMTSPKNKKLLAARSKKQQQCAVWKHYIRLN